MSEEKLKEGFDRFDLDSSGSISCIEVKHVLEQTRGMDPDAAKETAMVSVQHNKKINICHIQQIYIAC